MTRNMLIITNASGEIIAASHEDLNAEMQVHIYPANPTHKMYRVVEVPDEIASLKDAHQFHRAITEHFISKNAKVSSITAQEHVNFVIASERKKKGRTGSGRKQ